LDWPARNKLGQANRKSDSERPITFVLRVVVLMSILTIVVVRSFVPLADLYYLTDRLTWVQNGVPLLLMSKKPDSA
jgi:hypothetical protein